MALLYPETSPTAPVTRDDIARLMTMQAMQQDQGVTGDFGAGAVSSSAPAGHDGPGGSAFGNFGSGAPAANSNPDQVGADRSAMAGMMSAPAAMTTSEHSIVSPDPGNPMASDSVSGRSSQAFGGSTFSNTGGLTENALSNSVGGRSSGSSSLGLPGGNSYGAVLGQSLADLVADNSTEGIVGYGGPATGGKGAAVAGLPGSPGSPMSNAFDMGNMPNAGALPTGNWDAFAGAPVTSGVPGNRGFGGIPGYGDIPGGIFDAGKGFISQGWDAVTGGKGGMSGMSENAMNQGIADMIGNALADPGWGGGSGARSGGGAVTTGGGGARSGGGAATTGGFSEGAANQGIADMIGAALADPGWGGGATAPGSGGYGPDFAGTGGYSGSGDVGNTSGAVGGFGGSDGAGDGAGAGAGTGGSSSGSDSGSDGASGGVG